MKKITVFLMSIVFMTFMGRSVFAATSEPAPVPGTTPIVTDPIAPAPIDTGVIAPCKDGTEVCATTSGEGPNTVGTITDVTVCSIDKDDKQVCADQPVTGSSSSGADGSAGSADGSVPTTINGTTPSTIDGSVPADCSNDQSVCEKPTHSIETMAPADGKYQDGIYYLTGAKDLASNPDTTMVTVSVVASTVGLILLGIAVNRRVKKN